MTSPVRATSSSLEVPALDNTLGALLIGTCVGLVLYGLILHQTYRYFRLYPKDGFLIRVFVWTTLALETFHTACCCHVCYYYMVSHYFQPLTLLSGTWSVEIQPVTVGLAICTSQLFFARRVFLISRKYRYLVAVAVILSVTALGFSTAATVQAFRVQTWSRFSHWTWLDSAGFGTTTLADALTASVLVITLRRSRTGFKRTDGMLDGIVLYTINTGLLTGVFNGLSFVFALAYPKSMIYLGVIIVATKMYANSLMAVLNSRKSLQQEATRTLSLPMELNTMPKDHTLTTAEMWNVPQDSQNTEASGTVIDIKVDTKTTQWDSKRSFDSGREAQRLGVIQEQSGRKAHPGYAV